MPEAEDTTSRVMSLDVYKRQVLNMLHERLHCNAVPIQLPIGAEDAFKGIVDLLEMKAYGYYDDLGKDIRCLLYTSRCV